ncbi:MAG: zinc-dependent metalloprotease [Fimbriimonadales bacterium]|nr:zinc-dependent metalloprotease [Fimbriimonadales bacterium]
MRTRQRFVVAWLLLLVTTLGAVAQEKVLLRYRAQAGQTARYRVSGTTGFDILGNTVQSEVSIVYSRRITEVSPEGNITWEEEYESIEVKVGGQPTPLPDQMRPSKATITIKPNGEVIKRESSRTERAGPVDAIGTTPPIIFGAEPVGAGDQWRHTFEENEELGITAGEAEYTLKGFETWNGIRVARILVNFTVRGEVKGSSESEMLVELRTGDVVYATLKGEASTTQGELTFKVTFNLTLERIEGSLLPEGVNGTPANATPAQTESKPQQPTEQKAEKAEQPKPANGEKKDEKKDDAKKKEKTIEEVTKDFEKLEGLFTLYRKKESGKDTIYMEIRREQLGKLYFLQATVSEGIPTFFLAAGSPINDIVFKFVQRDDQILMVVPNYRFRAESGTPIARSVQRSFANAYLEAFKIEAKSDEGKRLLIDVTSLFRSDLIQIQQLVNVAAGGNYTIDREKTVYNQVKAFPNNIFIQTAYHFTGGPQRGGGLAAILGSLIGGANLIDPRSIPITVNYNLWELPTDNGYVPRFYDPRVGYFFTAYDDFTREREDQTRRFILRWHIEKADPNAELSPPKEPIVFWLDNAIPVEYRDAIREGILEWNKAFERIGIKDAIVVKQMPDDAEWDHADMRYNVVRWVTSPSNGYAVAQFRINPLTGQILNASITIDGNMARFTRVQFLRQIDPLAAFKEAERHERCCEHHAETPQACTIVQDTLLRAWQGYVMMELLAGKRGATKVTEEEFVKAYLKSIAMHEMGHILGLRHNFAASRMLTLEQLKDGELVRQRGTVASVMEYDPFNQMALHAPNTYYWNPTIGPYDYWAIEYGYRIFPDAKTPEAELPYLQAIARRNTEPELAYETDEYADRFDPYVTRFDLGKEPLEYWELVIKDAHELLEVLPARIPAPSESYYDFTRYFFGTLAIFSRAAVQLSRYIGGLHIRRNFATDPNAQPPLEPVSGDKQRRALQLLATYIFSEKAFNLPKGLYLRLAPNPYGFGGSIPADAPVRDFISNIQRLTLQRLLAADTLRRVANNEFKVVDKRNTLTLAELFDTLQRVIWSEASSARPVSELRRQLQRAHLQALVDMLTKETGVPDDAEMLARYHLRQLREQLARRLPHVQDTYTRAHYSEAIETIEKALNAQYLLGMPEFRMPSLAELLGLGRE